MPDIVDGRTRSRMMSGIRSGNTKPELLIRKGLHALGFRYKLHDRNLAGRPDMVFPRYRAAVFVHGCFWHGHDCPLFKLPETRRDFWLSKIERNRERDERVLEQLYASGWRTLTVWECSIRGRYRIGLPETLQTVAGWLQSDELAGSIRGLA